MIFETKDPLNRKVVLKRKTWEYKILNYNNNNSENQHGNSHVDMEHLLSYVKKTIEKPLYIIKDVECCENDITGQKTFKESDTREEYIRVEFHDDNRLKIIKAVVEFSDDSHGEIVTTHKMKKASDIKKEGSRIIYEGYK